MLKDLVRISRSIRRFSQECAIDHDLLRELVDLARLCPSGANLQGLKYLIVSDPEQNAVIFSHLAWAGYIKDWDGPAQGERPSAYIVICNDTSISKTCGCDHGIAAQTIMLGAAEKGLGGCMIGSVKRKELHQTLALSSGYEIMLVLALGKPKEEVVIDPIAQDGGVKYWRDKDDIHHVPKRSLEDLLI